MTPAAPGSSLRLERGLESAPGGIRTFACALGAAALALPLAAAPAHAAKVVDDGFEAGLGAWAVTHGGDGSFGVQGAEVATGARAARWSISARAGSVAYARRSLGTPLTDLTVTFAGRVDVEGASGSNVPLLRLLSSNGARTLYVYRQNAASNKVYASYAGAFIQTTGTLPLRTFARFALRVVVHGATSVVTLRENGATVYSTTTASLGGDPIAALQLGNETAKQVGTAVIDDVAVYDATGSDTLIASGPSGPTPSTSAGFAFSSPDRAATFQCNLDGGAYAACTSPKAYAGVVNGPHLFGVRAVDAAGYVDATPAQRAFAVDTVAPDTAIASGPIGTVTSSAAAFTFVSSDATATFRCSLDGAPFAPCTSPVSYDGLASGPHAFTVRAVDAAGNADPAPPTRTWTVSLTALPETTITTGPDGPVASASASFDFASDNPSATFECSLDGAPFAPCAAPEVYPALAEGAHVFHVRAVDAAGADATPAARSFTVDTVAPDVAARRPAPGDADAAFGTTVAATFSEPIDPATLRTATFALIHDGAPVAAAVTLDAAGVTATLTPAAPLLPNGVYAATLAGGPGGIADAAGNPLAGDVTWSFTTPAELVGAGDIADCGNGNHAPAQTAALLAATPGDVFTAGDNAYPHGAAADFASCYDPSWGRERARTHPAIGNHELETQNGLPYYEYFGDAAGVPWVGDYSYDLGAWHVVVLNSNCDVVGCGVGSAQETWLRADLAAHPNACTLAVWHHPRFSSGAHGPDARLTAFWKALYDDGADLVVNGHDHDYERFAPQTPSGAADPAFGITELVVGTGGAESRPRASTQRNSVVFATAFGVVRLVLHPTGYDWQFLAAPGSALADAGHADCHGAPAMPPTPAPYFGDGFESGLGAWTIATGDGGRVATGSAVVRVGASALELAGTTAATSFASARRAVAPARAELTASLDFRVAAEGAASDNVSALRLLDAAGNRVVGLYRQNATGELWVTYDDRLFRVAPALPLDTWTRLTLHVIVGAPGASTVEVLKDGSRIYASTTASLGASEVASVEVGNDAAGQAFVSYADDVAITYGGP